MNALLQTDFAVSHARRVASLIPSCCAALDVVATAKLRHLWRGFALVFGKGDLAETVPFISRILSQTSYVLPGDASITQV